MCWLPTVVWMRLKIDTGQLILKLLNESVLCGMSLAGFCGVFNISQIIDEALGKFFGHGGENFHHDLGHERFGCGVEVHRDAGGVFIDGFECVVADIV